MKRTTLSDLRDHLFETIERLKLAGDPDASDNERISIETAKTIAEVGQVIVNSAKLEVEAMKIISRSENPKETLDAMKSSSMMLLEVNHVPAPVEEPVRRGAVIEQPTQPDPLPEPPAKVVEKSDRDKNQDEKLAEFRQRYPINNGRPVINRNL